MSDKTLDALRLAREALRAVEFTLHASGFWCEWCPGRNGNHTPDCLRQRALAAIDEAVAHEKTKRIAITRNDCPGVHIVPSEGLAMAVADEFDDIENMPVGAAVILTVTMEEGK